MSNRQHKKVRRQVRNINIMIINMHSWMDIFKEYEKCDKDQESAFVYGHAFLEKLESELRTIIGNCRKPRKELASVIKVPLPRVIKGYPYEILNIFTKALEPRNDEINKWNPRLITCTTIWPLIDEVRAYIAALEAWKREKSTVLEMNIDELTSPNKGKMDSPKKLRTSSLQVSKKLDQYAIGFDGNAWHYFKKVGDKFRHQKQLAPQPKGNNAHLLRMIYDSREPELSQAKMIENVVSKVGETAKKHTAKKYSDGEGRRIIRKTIQPRITRLRHFIRNALGIPKFCDPMPLQKCTRGYRLMIEIGEAEMGDDNRLHFTQS